MPDHLYNGYGNPADEATRRRAWTILRQRQRIELALADVGLPHMVIEPALIAAEEVIALGDPQPDFWAVLDATKAIIDAHICARKALRPDPTADAPDFR
jgi:hypothetical protein